MHAHTDTETVISRPDSSPWTEKWGSCWQTTKVVENPESCASKNPSPEWVDHFWICNWPANVKDPAAVENGKTVKSHCWSRIFDLVFVALEKTPHTHTHTHTHEIKSEWWRSRLEQRTEQHSLSVQNAFLLFLKNYESTKIKTHENWRSWGWTSFNWTW